MRTLVSPPDYVPESRFGVWFQRTEIWRRYVLSEAASELAGLLPAGGRTFPRILDAGCGEGHAFEILRSLFGGQTILGVDIDPAAVVCAKQIASQLGGGIDVSLADTARLPLEDGSLDLVFCHQLLHHATDPLKVLRELHRIIVPGGWILVAESCQAFLDWWPVRLLFRHPDRPQYSAAGYLSLVGEAGFQITPGGVLTPSPWWSQPDLAIWRTLGGSIDGRNPRQVRIAARRPGKAG